MLRQAFRYRSAGGEKLAVIATAMGEDDGTASRLLDPNDRTKRLTDDHLRHLDRCGFAHVAAAVRSVRIEDVASKLGVAGLATKRAA